MIDTHAHLDFPEFDSDREPLFTAMRSVGINTAIIPAVETCHWDRVRIIAEQYNCFYALGIHPWMMSASKQDTDLALLDSYLQNHRQDKRLVAVGETGLDALKGPSMDVQLSYLQKHIQLAGHHQLPLILHCVRAHDLLLDCLKKSPPSRGVIHGFSASLELAREYLKLGYCLGVGGMLLNANAKKLCRAVMQLPLAALVIETDSPAMSPIAGERNTPLILPRIVDEIARLQNKSSGYISEQLSLNAQQLFEL